MNTLGLEVLSLAFNILAYQLNMILRQHLSNQDKGSNFKLGAGENLMYTCQAEVKWKDVD